MHPVQSRPADWGFALYWVIWMTGNRCTGWLEWRIMFCILLRRHNRAPQTNEPATWCVPCPKRGCPVRWSTFRPAVSMATAVETGFVKNAWRIPKRLARDAGCTRNVSCGTGEGPRAFASACCAFREFMQMIAQRVGHVRAWSAGCQCCSPPKMSIPITFMRMTWPGLANGQSGLRGLSGCTTSTTTHA